MRRIAKRILTIFAVNNYFYEIAMTVFVANTNEDLAIPYSN